MYTICLRGSLETFFGFFFSLFICGTSIIFFEWWRSLKVVLKVWHLAITHLSPPHIAFSDKSKYLETGHRAQARGESRGDNFHRQVTLGQVTEGVPTNHKGRRCASCYWCYFILSQYFPSNLLWSQLWTVCNREPRDDQTIIQDCAINQSKALNPDPKFTSTSWLWYEATVDGERGMKRELTDKVGLPNPNHYSNYPDHMVWPPDPPIEVSIPCPLRLQDSIACHPLLFASDCIIYLFLVTDMQHLCLLTRRLSPQTAMFKPLATCPCLQWFRTCNTFVEHLEDIRSQQPCSYHWPSLTSRTPVSLPLARYDVCNLYAHFYIF